MLTEADLPALTSRVLWAAFLIGTVFGAIAQRTHFCTMGAVADIVNMGDTSRARMWAMAIGIGILGFNAMAALGWVQPVDSVYTTPRLQWLSNLLGGLMFGIGMVLASGCGSKTLVRLGAGSLKSLTVFVVLGVAAYATMRGITAVARQATVDQVAVTLATGQDLPSIVAAAAGASRTQMAAILGAVFGLGFLGWALARPEGRTPNVLIGGFGIGLCVLALWWVSGQWGYVEEHPQTLEKAYLGATNAQRLESLTFVAPIAYVLDGIILFSDKSKTLTIGIVTVLGVILGAALVALATRTFRFEGFVSTQDTALHLAGAVLMGVGGVLAMGCTVGQGITGVSTLAVGSFIALAGIVLGGVLGVRFQVWLLERSL